MADAVKRSPWFWVALAGGGACALCSIGTLGLAALGALGNDASPVGASPSGSAPPSGSEWVPAGEVARATGLTQSLSGGRWLAQTGSQLESVKARMPDSVLVQTSSSGTLHELRFDDDGSYQWQWVHSSNFVRQSRSSADERGEWSLAGTTLTLTPRSQKALYTAGDQSTEKEDLNLSVRSYQVVDLTLERVPHTGAPAKRFPGVGLAGPRAAWDIETGDLKLPLQRL